MFKGSIGYVRLNIRDVKAIDVKLKEKSGDFVFKVATIRDSKCNAVFLDTSRGNMILFNANEELITELLDYDSGKKAKKMGGQEGN